MNLILWIQFYNEKANFVKIRLLNVSTRYEGGVIVDLINSIGVEHIALIIIILTLIMFTLDKLPIALTALISSIMLALVGAMDYTQIYAGFTTPVTMLVFGMMIVGYSLFSTGVVTIVGKQILKSRFAQNEKILLVMLMFIAGIASAFLSNTALIATFVPLIGAIVAASPGKLTNKNLLMPLGMAASVGGTISLVGSTSQPVASGILEEYGYGSLGMFDFAWVAIPLLLVVIVYMYTVGYKMEQKTFDFADIANNQDTSSFKEFQPTRKTYIAAGTMIFCIVSFVTGIFPIEVTALIGAAIVLATGCIDFKQCMRQLDWNTVLLIAFAQGIAAGMNDSGAGELVAGWSVNLVGDNIWILFIIAIVLTVILTNIMSNTAVAAMMTPIFIGIVVSIGYDPYVFVLGIAIATNASIATPIGGTAMSQTLVAGYRFKDYLKLGVPITAILTIMIIFLTPLIFGFTEL